MIVTIIRLALMALAVDIGFYFGFLAGDAIGALHQGASI